MRAILEALGGYLLLAITAVTVENAVFSRALGVSRLISLTDDTTDTSVFAVLLAASMTLSGGLYWLALQLISGTPLENGVYRALVAVVSMSVSFFVIFILAVKLMPYQLVAKAAAAMPGAAFNSMVLGTLFLTAQNQMDLIGTLVFCLFSSVGFTLAVLLVTEGQRWLQNREMPAAFKGLPATILYLSGLSMAVYALVGHVFSL